MIDIPLTEAERMQARSHSFKMAVLRWAVFGTLFALALIFVGLASERSRGSCRSCAA